MGKMIRDSKEISALMKQDNYLKVVTPSYFSFAHSDKESIDLTKMPWLNTQNIDGKYAFYFCVNLKTLNLTNINTNLCQDMSDMFNGCNSLTTLDIGSLKTDNVTYMSNMFEGCSNLKTIDFGTRINTIKVTNMSQMFRGCDSLTSLDLSSFNTSNVTNMSGMFRGCRSLTTLDMSSFNTSNVTDMGMTFEDCLSLTSLDVSNFDTSKVTNMFHTFLGCKALTELDLTNWDVRKVTQFGKTLGSKTGMFYGCTNLKSIKFGDKFTPPQNANFAGMFGECSSLQSLDLTHWGTIKASINNYEAMFRNCTALAEIKNSGAISLASMSKNSTLTEMFYGCQSLTSLNLSSLIISDSKKIVLKNTFANCTSLKHLDISQISGKGATITGAFLNVPDDCEILVKDEAMKTKIESAYSNLTNVKVKGA